MGVYRGAGGVVWEIDPPKEGTQARERFDAQVESGELVLVDEPPAESKKASASKKAAAATEED